MSISMVGWLFLGVEVAKEEGLIGVCLAKDMTLVEVGSVILAPRAENAKINVTDEPYFGTYILCSYLPLSKAAKGAQCGPRQYETFERKHSPTEK